MFVAVMGFHARISDPAMGGTYMTLLNTLSNLGGTLAGTIALWLVDIVSFKGCEGVGDLSLDCDTQQELEVSGSQACIPMTNPYMNQNRRESLNRELPDVSTTIYAVVTFMMCLCGHVNR